MTPFCKHLIIFRNSEAGPINIRSYCWALIANLDLVISVDTAPAHLAALGKPVWVLGRFDSCWRWRVGEDDNPWYPTVRLYRQPPPEDWDGMLAAAVGTCAQGKGDVTFEQKSLADQR